MSKFNVGDKVVATLPWLTGYGKEGVIFKIVNGSRIGYTVFWRGEKYPIGVYFDDYLKLKETKQFGIVKFMKGEK